MHLFTLKIIPSAWRKPLLGGLSLVLSLVATGCDYEVPITRQPTRQVDSGLVGDWIAKDGWMKVRRFDASGYVVFHNGELYRAWHSEVAGLPLVSVQDIDSEKGKYAYLAYVLSDDGRRLALRVVNDKLIPANTKDSDRVKQLLEKHASDPALFGQDFIYIRQ